MMGAQTQGAYAPRIDEGYIEPSTMLPEGSQIRCKDKIEKHNMLHDPAMPWYNIRIQAKSRDDFHRRAEPTVLPVLQFDFAVAGTQQG